MAISPSTSRKLREALGQDAGADLVTWLEEEQSERQQLRADFAEIRQDLHALETRLTQRISTASTDLSDRIAKSHSDLMRWSFVFWTGAVAAIALLAGVLRR